MLVERSFRRNNLGKGFEIDFFEQGDVGEIAIGCQAGPVEVGFVLYLPRDLRNRYTKFYELWVDYGVQGRGLGKKAEKSVVDIARNLGSHEVLVTSMLEESSGFWEKVGYEVDYDNMEGKKLLVPSVVYSGSSYVSEF